MPGTQPRTQPQQKTRPAPMTSKSLSSLVFNYKTRQTPPSDRPTARNIKLSPNGRSIVYRYPFTEASKFPYFGWAVFTRDLDANKSVQRTPTSTLGIFDVWWNNDGNQIYVNQYTQDRRKLVAEDIGVTIYSALNINWPRKIQETRSGRVYQYIKGGPRTVYKEIRELFE